MVDLLCLLANIAVINKCKHIFLYFFLISFFLNFQIFQETFRKLCCGNFPSFRKLSWKLPETAWKFATLLISRSERFPRYEASPHIIHFDQSNQTNTVSFHQYADYTQLYNSSTLTSQIASIESCTRRVHDWLVNNGLHLNQCRSKAMIVLLFTTQ